ncbi:hydantoinase B/oxoprolinase family protein [Bacillus sp. FSL K6-3431]|uniref:hydantoinase B/oxoprolinase family protein n=1 Tax=Bacillus sp. FSL K6-3431 TaxID=2921500 RepID=UPI0030FAC9F0
MIQAQILYNKLQSICREMGDRLERISRSPLLSQDRAFATGLFTNDLKVAVQNQYEPEHLFALKDSVENLFDYFSFDVADGDILLVADPYSGGTKGQTLTMVAPLFHEGELVLFPVIRAQMMDLAGEYPGGFHPEAFEVWQESIRITPIKLYKQGLLQMDVLRFLLANSRVPTSFKADLDAMYSCLQGAQEQIKKLLSNYGQHTLYQSIESMFQYNKKKVIHHLSQIPICDMKSTVEFEIVEGEKVFIEVIINRTENQMRVDFTGSSNQSNKPINSPISTTKAFAVWPFLANLADEIAINEGTLEPFIVKTKKGSIVDPDFPASTALSPSITGHFISEAIFRALKKGKVSTQDFPPIFGIGPQAIFYPPLGERPETKALVLVPGFPVTSTGWGPPGLYGQKMLVSAEELEFYHGFKMFSREWIENENEMRVSIINQSEDVFFNLLLPYSEEETYGSLSKQGEQNKNYLQSTTGEVVKSGEQLVFKYSGEGTQL